jgi:pimeloyl-ACP methyl ester carboxylesterase
MRRTSFVLLTSVLIVLLGGTGLAIAQEVSPVSSPTANGDIADRFDVGGRSLYLECHGQGSPTIVLEGGSGSATTDWRTFSRELTTVARVCAYDRANVGQSDPDPGGVRTAADVVADLHALLERAGVPGPYVLAAHSLGGLFSRLYATTYPDDVAGLVLIDGLPLGFDDRWIALVPANERAAVRDNVRGPSGPEHIDYFASEDEVAAAQPSAVPTIVITHGLVEGELWDGSIGPMFPPTWPIDQMEALWQDLQRMQAQDLGGRLVVAEASGHFVFFSQPELVIASIGEIVQAVHDPASWATPAA